MATRIVIDNDGVARLRLAAQDLVHEIGADVESDAQRFVPVDTGELRSTIRLEKLPMRARVWVGTDHWAPTEYGSRPHWITTDMRSLRSDGGQFFGPRVWHPGTPEQPFMRPALYRYRSVL